MSLEVPLDCNRTASTGRGRGELDEYTQALALQKLMDPADRNRSSDVRNPATAAFIVKTYKQLLFALEPSERSTRGAPASYLPPPFRATAPASPKRADAPAAVPVPPKRSHKRKPASVPVPVPVQKNIRKRDYAAEYARRMRRAVPDKSDRPVAVAAAPVHADGDAAASSSSPDMLRSSTSSLSALGSPADVVTSLDYYTGKTPMLGADEREELLETLMKQTGVVAVEEPSSLSLPASSSSSPPPRTAFRAADTQAPVTVPLSFAQHRHSPRPLKPAAAVVVTPPRKKAPDECVEEPAAAANSLSSPKPVPPQSKSEDGHPRPRFMTCDGVLYEVFHKKSGRACWKRAALVRPPELPAVADMEAASRLLDIATSAPSSQQTGAAVPAPQPDTVPARHPVPLPVEESVAAVDVPLPDTVPTRRPVPLDAEQPVVMRVCAPVSDPALVLPTPTPLPLPFVVGLPPPQDPAPAVCKPLPAEHPLAALVRASAPDTALVLPRQTQLPLPLSFVVGSPPPQDPAPAVRKPLPAEQPLVAPVHVSAPDSVLVLPRSTLLPLPLVVDVSVPPDPVHQPLPAEAPPPAQEEQCAATPYMPFPMDDDPPGEDSRAVSVPAPVESPTPGFFAPDFSYSPPFDDATAAAATTKEQAPPSLHTPALPPEAREPATPPPPPPVVCLHSPPPEAMEEVLQKFDVGALWLYRPQPSRNPGRVLIPLFIALGDYTIMELTPDVLEMLRQECDAVEKRLHGGGEQ